MVGLEQITQKVIPAKVKELATSVIKKNNYTVESITPKSAPQLIERLSLTNVEFADALQTLQSENVPLALRTQNRVTPDAVEAFDRVKLAVAQGAKGDIPLLTAKAIVQSGGELKRGNSDESPELASDLQTVTNAVNNLSMIVINGTFADPESHSDRIKEAKSERIAAALQQANAILHEDPEIQKYAIHRLTWDLKDEEKKAIFKVIGIAALAAGAGYLLENVGGHMTPESLIALTSAVKPVQDIVKQVVPHLPIDALRQTALGGGLLITGQADDAASAFSTFKTEQGGSKPMGQILRENKSTLAFMGLASAIDFGVLPTVFAHSADTWYWPLVAGGLFAFTAYAGSISGKLSNIKRSASTIRELDKKGQLPGYEGQSNNVSYLKSWWMGLEENQSHPFRVGLLAGITASTILALGASVGGVLEGHAISSTIQAAIGPLETFSALAATGGVAEFMYAKIRKAKDSLSLRRVRKAKSNTSVQVAPVMVN